MLEELKKRKSKLSVLSSENSVSRVSDWISTQCSPLDLIMGGGIPVGRMTEIYGDTSTGKTLLGLHILAETQRIGGIAAMLDTETAVAIELAETIGVDVDNLIYSCPDVIEDVCDDLMELVKAKQEIDPDGIMTILWDSVAATSSEAEVAKVMEKGLNTGYPPTAKEISQMMRVMKKIVAQNHIALVMLNQTREKIGVMFGDNVSTFGGKAVGFYSSIRLMLKQSSQIKHHDNVIGITARAYVSKNKVAPPFGKCSFPILFDVGVDDAGAVLEWLKREKIVRTRGAWSYIDHPEFDGIKFQGSGWNDVYNGHRELLLDLMYSMDEEYEEGE